MGLDALNQLVAQAQVDDLADMVDQALRNSRPMQRSLSVLQADPQAMALIRSRALAYDPEFHAPPEFFNNLESDADYVNAPTLATHDLHHVLAGFNFDRSGELGVISVSVAQYGAHGFAFISWATVLASWWPRR